MTPTPTVDLNCDMGESFGAWTLGNDAALMPFITSANIACGFHAGDPAVMKQTVRTALHHGVALGAHPGLPDLVGFGRRNLDISAEEAFDMTVYQLGALAALARAEGGQLHHLKPHGALYNMAATNAALAQAIAEAVYKVQPELVLYGLAGSELTKAGEKLGLKTAHEVFADRTYQANGTLTPRRQPDALITSADAAIAQVLRMVKGGGVRTQQGTDVAIRADTVCLHGDGAHALEFAQRLNKELRAAGVQLKAATPATAK
ncbi:5-oxoprolinase subunit PxpA [Hymenobacter sp. BT770]|uniref:LamB/YcsF family protein n=1 Tax=Hymenobacter sp. BT770 TaxID=2886942 RepID=UPI001D0F7E5A|nr:5-oxoprolinase subunit PxpA [Hymenobacter sp. BT770]MCC3153335.1 LamB/YcsF family protein [Hymenobacter sp. BT770]MDO3414330.1 5-oxoprolinase subunit PxpA [Hymenobacter sp. BT770]